MLRCTPPLGYDISKFEFRNIVGECRASQPPLGCDISKFEFRNIVRAVGRRAYRARVQHVARRQPGCPRWHCHGRRAACGAHAARPTAVPCRLARSRGHPSCFPAPLDGLPAGAPIRAALHPTALHPPSTHFAAVPPRTGGGAWFPAIRGCAHAGTPARCPGPARPASLAEAGSPQQDAALASWPVAARPEGAGRQGTQASGTIRAKSRRECGI